MQPNNSLERAQPQRNFRSSRCSNLPERCGVYLVRRLDRNEPRFLRESGAGWFKSKDPSYPPDVVQSKWVPGATILYVGKTASKKGLRGRVRELVDFAYGKRVGHRGGRLLWHLEDWENLEVLWFDRPADEVDRLETRLIDSFRCVHGVRPFANMAK